MRGNTSSHTEVICKGQIKIPYAWPAGRLGGHFLKALRDQKTIWGLRCPSCRKVTVPPARCLACDQVGTEWVQVGPQGTLEAWTVVRTPAPSIRPLSVPYVLGLIRLDGADTGLMHILRGVAIEKLRSGIRIEPVFHSTRCGHILDIRYFKPSRER